MSEIDRRLAGALADLAEHYERAMTRQAEQNEQLQVKTLRSHVIGFVFQVFGEILSC